MVTKVSTRGYKDWLFQRASAIFLAIYTFFMVGFFLRYPHLTYTSWLKVVHSAWFGVSTIIMLLALFVHAWIGLWTIFTDYIHHVFIRMILQILVLISFMVYLGWTIVILWG